MYRSLPIEVREMADAAYVVFQTNPFAKPLRNHPLADTKQGRHRAGSRSVSIGLRYRAIYVPDDVQHENVFYWIGSHEAYNNFAGLK